MNSLREEIDTAVNMSTAVGEISEIWILSCLTTDVIKLQIEVTSKGGAKFPFKMPINSSKNYDEVAAEFKDAYPEYFI